MLLNRSIKTLPPPRRHNAVTIRLTDMIEWLGQRPPSKALDKTIALLTEARREILRAWPEFADLSPPDPEAVRPAPPVPKPTRSVAADAPRNGGRFQRKEPTT